MKKESFSAGTSSYSATERRSNRRRSGDSHRLSWRNMPDGDVLLFCLVVDGHVGRLVDFGWLKYQHLEEQKTGGWSLAHSQALVLAGFGDVCEYREAQAVGGALRGLHDDVHPEVEPLPLGGMVHDLLFKALNQL